MSQNEAIGAWALLSDNSEHHSSLSEAGFLVCITGWSVLSLRITKGPSKLPIKIMHQALFKSVGPS